jgi:acylphosphatase
MKVQARFFVLIAILLSIAIISFAVDVKTDYDHHANFSQYRTYSWAKVEMPDPLWNDRVKEAVDKELTQKGWTQVPSNGDVSVVAVGTTHEKRQLRTFYDGFDGWLWGGFGDATTVEETYDVGTLIIDMFDTSTKKLIWRGSATDTLAGNPRKDTDKLNKAVHKMFEHFPPKSQ